MDLPWLDPPRLRARVFRVMANPAVDLAIAVLIVSSVVLLTIEQATDLPEEALSTVSDLESVITSLLALELLIRFWLARHKGRFFRRYWPDILAVAPIFRALRFLWILRLFRLFRLGVVLSRRVGLFRDVLRVNVYEFWALGVAGVLLVIGASIASFTLEGATNPDFSTLTRSFWWSMHSVIAGEPVGASPATTGGKMLLVAVMIGGSTLFAAVTGVVSATMVNRLAGRKDMFDMDIEELESHIVICGWNAGVPALVGEISRDKRLSRVPLVLVSDTDNPLPQLKSTGARAELLYWMRGDHARMDVLRKAGVERAARAVVMTDAHVSAVTDRDARTVLAALTIEKLNPKIHCTVELMDGANEGHLRVAGVEAIVMRNDLAGRVLAIACRDPSAASVLMDLATLTFGQTIVRRKGPLIPTAFGEIVIKTKAESGALAIAVERGDKVEVNPRASSLVGPDDFLLVIDSALSA
ncbi:MAG: ion transporter [Deltaproteobacteria bacterium]|nr:ion transporter [Deltaproteobacteria bacterium]